jgi:hypothetical protein
MYITKVQKLNYFQKLNCDIKLQILFSVEVKVIQTLVLAV